MRETVILHRILTRFAPLSEVRRYDQLAKTNKASSTAMALRMILRDYKSRQPLSAVTREKTVDSRENTPRFFKINENGHTRLQRY